MEEILKQTLFVDLRTRLPDINRYENLDAKYQDYGRVAIDRNNNLTVMQIRSSHPATTQIGFYWAISNNRLFLSPRGAAYGWESYITESFIRSVVKELKLNRKYRYFKIVQDGDG